MEVQSAPLDEYVYLRGRPSVRDYISFARRYKINGKVADREPLMREWQEAYEHIRELEHTEKGFADDPELGALPESMAELAERGLDGNALELMWSGLAYRWRMVELDRLVVYQRFINRRFVSHARASLPETLSPEDIVRVALGRAWGAPPVNITRSDEYTFLCVSSSNDIRVLEIETVDPTAIRDYRPPGVASSVIAISIGFSPNVLSALRIRNRLVLINGSHRAYALREMGITHAPCVVLDVSQEHEFDLKVPDPVKENSELYLRHPRPPLFKDYFDPRLMTLMQVPRTNNLVQLQIGYQKIALSAME
jgi:hypothetical protein